MGDFNFYGNWEDSLIIIDQILRMDQFRIIADIGYRDKNILEVKSSSAIPQELISTTRQVYLWSNLYSKYPIKFGKPNSKNEVGIQELESGPLISMHLPAIIEREGKLTLGRGYIYSTPYFLIPDTYIRYRPTDELRKAFRSLKSTIQKSMEKRFWQPYKTSPLKENDDLVEPVWIGKKAFELFKTEGYFLLVGKNSWFKYSDLLIEQ